MVRIIRKLNIGKYINIALDMFSKVDNVANNSIYVQGALLMLFASYEAVTVALLIVAVFAVSMKLVLYTMAIAIIFMGTIGDISKKLTLAFCYSYRKSYANKELLEATYKRMALSKENKKNKKESAINTLLFGAILISFVKKFSEVLAEDKYVAIIEKISAIDIVKTIENVSSVFGQDIVNYGVFLSILMLIGIIISIYIVIRFFLGCREATISTLHDELNNNNN